jgi:hypothetical protein
VRNGLLQSVHRFATVSAELADPFAVRPATLARHDLDERGWARLCDAWRARFAVDAENARAFARAYATERQRLRAGGLSSLSTRRLVREEGPSPPERASHVAPADLGDMTALPVSRAVAVVPFTPGLPGDARAGIAQQPRVQAPEPPTSDDLDGTQQVSLDDTSLTLPFYKPPR